ncbi:MarR family winged helix-turn-helix transcriptional regulator [Bacilliculturomica massiliensis]|uniref:MarR family winged helix-turn-helix transcriptional regulator n=1 Tax=Bacilliculturomica massiliensis TaxID=1917867 RepID=UPI001FE988B4|nr:MarR family transcriptional regulator [Bacilliculturomica massiliensis]
MKEKKQINLLDSLNQYYFDMTVCSIRQLHRDAGLNISYNSVMYLDIISYQENCTISSLAETLQISRSAVTMKVNELVGKGLVVKTQSSQDRRVFYLRVSDEVERTLDAYDRPIEKAVRRIETAYTPEQIRTFCDMIRIFSEECKSEGDE